MAMGTLGEVRDMNKSAYHPLRRAGRLAADPHAREAGDRGLTHGQFAVLLTVARNEGLSQTRLGETTGIDRGTLADLVARPLRKVSLSAGGPGRMRGPMRSACRRPDAARSWRPNRAPRPPALAERGIAAQSG